MRWFLISCSCLYLLSESKGVTVDEDGSGKKRFLRTAMVSAEETTRDMLSEPSPTDILSQSNEEEFDYESYHATHHIPLPALSTTMMGLKNGGDDNEILVQRKGFFSFAGTSSAVTSFATESDEHEKLQMQQSVQTRGLSSFAGTNQAMLNFASGSNEEEDISMGRRMLSTQEENKDPLFETNMWMQHMPHVWELEEEEEVEQQARQDDSDTSLDSDIQPRTYSSHPRTDADLDNGRYLVGLEMRHIQVHQQIIIDYHDTNEFGEKRLEPIRIKFLLSDNAKNDRLLSSLVEKAFKETSELWSTALSVTPVSGRIYPTVDTCGSASIPLEDREKGVNGADILIYVTSDNRFCGGALIYAAVCDFDQHTRPLVGNINICTKNIPTKTLQGSEATITNQTMERYTGYITTETGRVLGASTSFFRYYKNPDTSVAYGTVEKTVTCVDGATETIEVPNVIRETESTDEVSYEIRTPKVIEVVRNHFDCMTLTGVKLESKKGGTSCFGGFLDDHLFFGEQLAAFQPARTSSLSPLTLALLEDSSWYVANYTVSSEIAFGRGSGCQFARAGCVPDNEHVNKGFHCTTIDTLGCDPSHSFKAKCDYLDSSSEACPMFVRGAVDCSAELSQAQTGEFFGKSSKCFNTDKGEPLCLKGICNEEDHTIDVHYANEVYTCASDGQVIDTNKGLRIECPRIAAVCPNLHCPSNCSGRGVCDEERDGRHTCICDNPFDDSLGCWAL